MGMRGSLRALVGIGFVLALATTTHAADPAAPGGAATGGGEATGTIAGQVIDASTGDPIIEAGVEVVDTGKQMRTDLDGRYSIKVPPGTYELRIFAPLYQGARLEKVVVEAGKIATAAMPAEAARAGRRRGRRGGRAGRQGRRGDAAHRSARRAPWSATTSAPRRSRSRPTPTPARSSSACPAVTVKDDKFIFVRGLGERYTSAMLNGSRLPSTDPDSRVVPLDLFPAGVPRSSISVIKTYTPDLPGDFSAGLADIELLDFPDQLTYGIGHLDRRQHQHDVPRLQDLPRQHEGLVRLRRQRAEAAVDHPRSQPGRRAARTEAALRAFVRRQLGDRRDDGAGRLQHQRSDRQSLGAARGAPRVHVRHEVAAAERAATTIPAGRELRRPEADHRRRLPVRARRVQDAARRSAGIVVRDHTQPPHHVAGVDRSERHRRGARR